MIATSALSLALSLAMVPQAEGDKDSDRYLSSLKLEISTIKDTVDPIDLLQFTVRFTNASDAPLRLELNRWLPGRAMVHLVDPDGRTWWPVTLGIKGLTPPIIQDLKGGEYVRFHGSYSLCFLRLGSAREAFRLPQPGTWKVWAEYGRSAGTIKSNTATFEVKENGRTPPKVRELFGNETWHRFAVGGEVKDSDLVPFREFVLSGVEEGQRDVMAARLGFRDLDNSRPYLSLELFKIAAESRLGNLDRIDALLSRVEGLRRSSRHDEALALLDKVETDPKDVVRRHIEWVRAEILKAKAKPLGYDPSKGPAEGK